MENVADGSMGETVFAVVCVPGRDGDEVRDGRMDGMEEWDRDDGAVWAPVVLP